MKRLLLIHFLFTAIILQAQNFWTETAPFATDVNCIPRLISTVNENVSWIVGTNPDNTVNRYSRSSDGGISWTDGVINLGSEGITIGSINATSETVAYLTAFSNSGGSLGGLWSTTDAGVTWTKTIGLFNQSSSFANFVHFWDVDNGIAVGSVSNYLEMYTTSDAGLTWNAVPQQNFPDPLPGTAEYVYRFEYEANGDFMMFATNKDRLFITNDKGMTWSGVVGPLVTFAAVVHWGNWAFKNNTEGIVTSNMFDFFRTENGALDWSSEFPDGYRIGALEYVPGTNGTYFTMGEDLDSNPGSSYSVNDGGTWTTLNDVDEDPIFPEKAKFASATSGLCIGVYASEFPSEQKRLFRLTDPLNRFLKKDSFNAKGFSATPNPTNGLLTLSAKNINSVMVCDLLGKLIISEHFDSLDVVVINLDGFRNGMYFAKIITSDGNTATVKIVKK